MAKVNLISELEKIQINRKQDELILEIKSFLSAESRHEFSVKSRVGANNEFNDIKNQLMEERLNSSFIFDLEDIQLLCARFRLRLLSSKLFKDEIPVEAIRAVKRVEAEIGFQFTKFCIIAPASKFHLKGSAKGPILLAKLQNGKFYYIYKWNSDITLFQQLVLLPFQHMGALAIFSMITGLATMLLMPNIFVDWRAEAFYRFFIFSSVSALVMTIAIIIGIANSKDFSKNVWNRNYLR